MLNLEDHIGDIIRKAIEMANISLSIAANSAEMDLISFELFLQTGIPDEQPNYKKLGELLDLDTEKLQRIANGWHPPAIKTDNWKELRKLTSSRSNNTVNCYLIWQKDTKKAALFDTGFDENMILNLLKRHSVELDYLFITHNHLDHCGLADILEHKFPEIKIHRGFFPSPSVIKNGQVQQSVLLDSLSIASVPLPGHTIDSVIYIISGWEKCAPPVAIVGDTLFAGSIGRIPYEPGLVKKAIMENIFSLPHDTLICPGHGPLTTVYEEINNNPFFKY